jgi:hypothetical protein
MKEINQAYEALQSSLINGCFRFERIKGVRRSTVITQAVFDPSGRKG